MRSADEHVGGPALAGEVPDRARHVIGLHEVQFGAEQGADDRGPDEHGQPQPQQLRVHARRQREDEVPHPHGRQRRST